MIAVKAVSKTDGHVELIESTYDHNEQKAVPFASYKDAKDYRDYIGDKNDQWVYEVIEYRLLTCYSN